jgi:hypothetical protein
MVKSKRKPEDNRAQKNIRYLICFSFKYFEIVLKPAAWYSSPYLINKSQKWGNCHRNMKAEKRRIL